MNKLSRLQKHIRTEKNRLKDKKRNPRQNIQKSGSLNLTKKADYGLFLLTVLAKKDTWKSMDRKAWEQTGISKDRKTWEQTGISIDRKALGHTEISTKKHSKNTVKTESIRVIANKNGLSFPFLQKIAGILQKGGLIAAERGKFGGYRLAKSPGKITLKEIFETLEGPIAIAPCFMETQAHRYCARSQFCKIKNGLKKINEEIKTTLFAKTLKHFI